MSVEATDGAPDRAADQPARRVGEAVFVLCLLPILTAVFAIGQRTPFWSDSRPLFLALGVATLAWWMAIALARQRCGDLRVVIAGAIALRLLGLVGWADLSRDVDREVWDGRVVASGVSPYAFGPDDPQLAALRAELGELHAGLERRGPYAAPAPLGQLVTAGIAAAGAALDDPHGVKTAWGLRLVCALCDLLLLWPLVVLLRRRRAPPELAVAWAWSPLAVIELAGSGHLDALALVLLVSGLALLVVRGARARRPRARGMLGLGLLAAAAQVKPLALCALPFVVRGRGAWKRLALFALLFALPVLSLGFLRGGFDGLGGWMESMAMGPARGGLAYLPIEWVLSLLFDEEGQLAERLCRLVLLGLWVVLGIRAFVLRRGPLASTAAVIGAYVVLTPILQPWTLLWILPFAALQPRASWLWLVGTAPLLYVPLADFRGAGTWTQGWEWLAMAAPFSVLFIYEARLAARSEGAVRAARRHMRLRRVRAT